MVSKSSAIDLPYFNGDLTVGVSGNHGSGNGLDAIAFAGTVTANLSWLTPTNSAVDHPLGYLAIGTVTLSSGTTMTVPQGSVVKFSGGNLNVNGASINATDTSGGNAAKIFTTFRDPAGIATCPSVFVSTTCGVISNDWGGISIIQDSLSSLRGSAAFSNTTIRYSYSDAISISSGATSNPAGIAGFGLVLTNSTLDHNNSDALYAQGTPVSVSGGTISNTTGRGIYASAGNLTVSGTAISVTTGEGIVFTDSSLTKTVSLTNNTITGAGTYGIYEYGGAPNPTISGNTITGSGLTGNKSSAIDLPYFNGDLAVGVSGNHGSGNGLDAITFAGTLTANLSWLTPTNSASDHPFGYLAIGTVNLSSGITMTVPQGSVVKFLGGNLNVNGASINATDTSGGNAAKIFTTFRDPAGIATCPSVFVSTSCGVITNDWGGISIIQDSVSSLRGSAAFSNTTIRYSYSDAISIGSGATSNPAGIAGFGLVLTNSTLDHNNSDAIYATSTPVSVSGSTISNTTGRGIYASAGNLTVSGTAISVTTGEGIVFTDSSLTKTASLTNNTITGAGSFGIYEYGGAANPTISGNTITGSGLTGNKSSAIDLPYFNGDLAVGVSGNHGSGNGLDAITFAGTITANMTWLTPTNSASDHAFGYLAIGTVNLSSGITMTVPQGSVVKFSSGNLNVNGASINATDTSGANAAKIFTTFRDPAGIATCPSVFVSTSCGVITNDWGGISIIQDSISSVRGSAAFTNANIRYTYTDAISISSGATTNPAGDRRLRAGAEQQPHRPHGQ